MGTVPVPAGGRAQPHRTLFKRHPVGKARGPTPRRRRWPRDHRGGYRSVPIRRRRREPARSLAGASHQQALRARARKRTSAPRCNCRRCARPGRRLECGAALEVVLDAAVRERELSIEVHDRFAARTEGEAAGLDDAGVDRADDETHESVRLARRSPAASRRRATRNGRASGTAEKRTPRSSAISRSSHEKNGNRAGNGFQHGCGIALVRERVGP